MASYKSRYNVSETDIAQLIGLGNFTPAFTRQFTVDYAALKLGVDTTETRISSIEEEIEIIIVRLDDHDAYLANLDVRLDSAEVTLLDHSMRIGEAEADIDDNRADFDAHVVDRDTHGVLGNIVGTLDYPTAITGGAVLLAAAVADAVDSAVNATATPTAAGATYVQVDAATWVVTLNEHKTLINQLTTDLNAAITQINALLAAMRIAKQLAP